MAAVLEHSNIHVKDVDGMIGFLRTAFPEFVIRHDAVDDDGKRWVHIGTDDTYIALYEATTDLEPHKPYSGNPGMNHLAYVVDDVDALRDRLLAAGYTDSTVPNDHPHRKRIYFYDPEGTDWEFVQYFSDDPAKRNDYDLPG